MRSSTCAELTVVSGNVVVHACEVMLIVFPTLSLSLSHSLIDRQIDR